MILDLIHPGPEHNPLYMFSMPIHCKHADDHTNEIFCYSFIVSKSSLVRINLAILNILACAGGWHILTWCDVPGARLPGMPAHQAKPASCDLPDVLF